MVMNLAHKLHVVRQPRAPVLYCRVFTTHDVRFYR